MTKKNKTMDSVQIPFTSRELSLLIKLDERMDEVKEDISELKGDIGAIKTMINCFIDNVDTKYVKKIEFKDVKDDVDNFKKYLVIFALTVIITGVVVALKIPLVK